MLASGEPPLGEAGAILAALSRAVRISVRSSWIGPAGTDQEIPVP